MVNHNLQVLAFRQLDEFVSLRGCGGERLLNKNVLAVFQGRFSEFVMSPDGGYDGDQIDVRGGKQLVAVTGAMDGGVSGLDALQGLGTLVADGDHGGMVLAVEVPDDIGPPVAVADNAYSNHVGS